MAKTINILFVADIVGKPGLQITEKLLPTLQKRYKADFCIVNGENAYEGKGLTDKELGQLLSLNVDAITSGNHIWDTFKSVRTLKSDSRILRPANYPEGNPGRGSIILEKGNGFRLGIINLQGRTFMVPIDNPFTIALKEISKLKSRTNAIFIDFHAEATAEKMALAWYLDGKVSAVVGTHTHVQTADERILPNGTAYITDAGMTGAMDSVIGMKKEVALHRFLYATNQKYEVAGDNLGLCAVLVTINQETGKAEKIERIRVP